MARLTGEVVFGALNVGLSKQEVVEVLMHTAPYSGFPKALNALTLAQEVLG
jgi:4-carboxymuconolactone decarboxylase